MVDSEMNKMNCSHCDCEIKEDDDFCPECGTLITEYIKCSEHKDINAEGVCVICCEPYCKECGIFINKVFFCIDHSEYSFSEGLVNLFNTKEVTQMEIIRDNFEQKGLHPLVFSPRIGIKSNLVLTYISPKESSPYELITNGEQILVVPFQEVIRAEEILDELNIIE